MSKISKALKRAKKERTEKIAAAEGIPSLERRKKLFVEYLSIQKNISWDGKVKDPK